MATRAASSRDWTCDSSSKKEEGIRVENLKVIKEDMVPKLTCGLGVGSGELAADDDLVPSVPGRGRYGPCLAGGGGRGCTPGCLRPGSGSLGGVPWQRIYREEQMVKSRSEMQH